MFLLVGCGGGGIVVAPGDMGGGDLAGPTTPPTFFAGDYVAFAGVTTSDRAVVIDAARTAWAIKLADGTRDKIADHAATAWIMYDTAFVEHDSVNGFGALAAWHADGPVSALTDATPDNSFAFSFPAADAAGHVAYWVRSSGGALADLVVDKIDHSAPHTILTGVDLSATSTSCWPNVYYVQGRLIGTHCAAGSASDRTLTSWDPDSGAAVDLLTSTVEGYSTHTGVGVLTTSTTGALTLVAADGSGAPRAIAANIKHARFTQDGSAIIAVTSAGALERIAVADGAVTALGPTGVAHLVGISSDGKFATYATMVDSTTFNEDLWLTSATASATPTALVATPLSQTLGYSFTDDNAFAFYATDYDANTLTGSLRARATAGGGSERTLGAATYTATPFGGARLVFGDHYGGTFPDDRVDLELVDLATSAAPTKLATQVLAHYEVSDDDKTIWYVQPHDGLHALALP
ncbi:MAG: hypothetical protein ACXVDD_27625 [Polyangia bacterium]